MNIKFKSCKQYKINLKIDNFEFVHTLREPTLDDYDEIDRFCKTQNTIEGRELKIQMENDPDLQLWNLVCIEVAGYEPNTKDEVPALHKIHAIQMLSWCKIIKKDKVTENYGKDALTKTSYKNVAIYLEVLQGPNKILTTHVFNHPNDKTYMHYKRLQSTTNSKLEDDGITFLSKLNSREYAKLYDELVQSSKGYESTNIPVVHKVKSVIEIFKSFERQLEKLKGN